MGSEDEGGLTYENQGGIEILVVLPDIVRVIFSCLFLVRCIEVKTGVVGLDGLKEYPESILEAMSVERPTTQPTQDTRRTILGQFGVVESPFHPYRPSHPWFFACELVWLVDGEGGAS